MYQCCEADGSSLFRGRLKVNSSKLLCRAGNFQAPCAFSLGPTQRRLGMDSEHVRGAADKAKGAIKETAGKVTGDKQLETEGKFDKAKGDLHNAAGNVKDAFKNATK